MKYISIIALLVVTGCSAFTPKVQVPSSKLTIDVHNGLVTWTSPKDTTASKIAVAVATNGTFSATVDSIQDAVNPTNIVDTANGVAFIVAAQGTATVNAINAAANAAGAIAAATAKTAAK
jgi:hypothetical protein